MAQTLKPLHQMTCGQQVCVAGLRRVSSQPSVGSSFPFLQQPQRLFSLEGSFPGDRIGFSSSVTSAH